MCQLLASAGAFPILFPVIDFAPLRSKELVASLRNLLSYQWIIFTSGNAARYFVEALEPQGVALLNQGTGPRIAAVGEATEQLLKQRGLRVALTPGRFTGRRLASVMGDLASQRVLLPRSNIGREELVTLLKEKGAVVHDIPFYETVTVMPPNSAFEELRRGVDALTFTSPSCVRGFDKSFSESRRWYDTLRASATIACIGPTTAEEATQRGFNVSIVPQRYTIKTMVQALEDYYMKAEPPSDRGCGSNSVSSDDRPEGR
jgi:uroporphyrinogen III methyltransferase/synthase